MNDPSTDPAEQLGSFLATHPDGDRPEFESWAKAQSTLTSRPELVDAVRNALERWHEAKHLPGANDGPGEVEASRSCFHRGERASEGAEGGPTGRTAANALGPGQQIGEFTLLRFIARGGMGEVWEAEDAALRRRVALKLVLPDRVDEQSLALFAREARAGGRLSHPNLVTTLGHGTDGGLTWISQELVEGSWTVKDSISVLRADENVPKGYYREVAELVARVADGMHAAHEAGVIHRDLKPQNILVSDDDQPKVTDFGLAHVTDDSFLSQSGDVMGTWAYMSPEQVTAKRMGLDHRTDVFSLGVVLYELLTLRRPFEGDTTHQIATRIITEDAPLATRVRSKCPSELSVICAKAMEKAPERRYGTMADLAADLRRHLDDEPILAKPPGPIVRTTKWVRRHPALSAAGAIASMALLVVSILSLNLARRTAELAEQTRVARASAEEADAARAETEEALANEEARSEELDRVAAFQAEQLKQIDATAMGLALKDGLRTDQVDLAERKGSTPGELEARLADFDRVLAGADMTGLALRAIESQILQPSLDAIDEEFLELPLVRAQLLQTIADTAMSLGLLELATSTQRSALRIRRRHLGDEHRDTLFSINNMGTLLESQGKLEEAESLYHEALQARREALGDEDPTTLLSINNMGSLLRGQGKLEEAEALFREALEASRRILGDEDPGTLVYINNMGGLLQSQGKLEEAEALLREALEASRRILGDDHRDTLISINNMGNLLKRQDRFDEAEPFYREALETSRRVLGDEHQNTLLYINNMGALLRSQG
ncbi:MAG: serine/threonine-protein kinase, partial [Planctomycetota bacterium]|nr:serine/threonine-protein kinase [Planctomycetota bacterium]